MHGVRISVGENRNGLDGKLPQGANHAAGDFATVGNEDFGKHGECTAVRKREARPEFARWSRLDDCEAEAFAYVPSKLIPDQQTNRCRIIGVAGVIQLRAIRNQADDIHLGLHFNISTLVGNAVCKGKPSVRSDRHIHKKIDIVSYIPLGVAMGRLCNRQQEGVPAIVHMLFFDRVPDLIALGRARSSQGIVPPTGVCHDGQQDIAFGRDQLRSSRQIDAALFPDGVLRAVSVGLIVRIVEKGVDRLVAFQIDNPERFAQP